MKKVLLSTLVSSLLLTSIAFADSNKTLTSKEVCDSATKVETTKTKNSQVKLVQEALSSLELTHKALVNLNEEKSDEAKKNIELALGKLESILALKASPKLLPIENQMVVKNFVGTADDVEKVLDRVKKLLSDGKVQEAGELLITLQSEIDVTVVSLPLVSYPDALKLANKYLLENKKEEAKKILALALNTFAKDNYIVPIPLVNTVELVKVASTVSKENKDLALKYLTSAHEELKKAEKLGYISSSTTTYKALHKLIDGVEKEVKGPNKAEKLFKELGKSLKEFKSKIFSDDKNSTK